MLHGGLALAQDARIVIGQSIALSGGVGEHGQGAAAGAKLYLDGINAAGGRRRAPDRRY